METCHCANCGRDIPRHNFDIHVAHCERNLIRCKDCKDMIPKGSEYIHYNEFHVQVACSHCGQSLEKVQLADHERTECPMRRVLCQFCDLDQVAADLAGHQAVCGNRTEWCAFCQKWVRLNEQKEHEDSVHTGSELEGGDLYIDRPTPLDLSHEWSQGNSDGEALERELSHRVGSNARSSDRNLILMATAGAAAVIVAVAVGALRVRHRRSF